MPPYVAEDFAHVLPGQPLPATAEPRLSDFSVFLNDYDVTVQAVLLGAIPPAFHEAINSGIPAHVRFTVELWQYNRMWPDRLLQSRAIERQVVYNVVTKEFKVGSVAGETREPYISRELREAQRVLSELRGVKLVPAATLDAAELFYVQIRAETALNGVNTFLARLSGEAEMTPWVRSSLLTVTRSQ